MQLPADEAHEGVKDEADQDERSTNDQDDRKAQDGERDGAARTPNYLVTASFVSCVRRRLANDRSIWYGGWPGSVCNDTLL